MSQEHDVQDEKLEIKSLYNFSDLESILRRVQLKDRNIQSFHPYLHSDISLQRVPIENLQPSAFYVLRSNLEKVASIENLLSKKGIHIFDFTNKIAGVNYSYEGREKIVFGPPIIEVSDEDSGGMIIADGLHRVTRAKMEGRKDIVVIKIENMAAPLPVLPTDWKDVKITDAIPEKKRNYRFDSYEQIKKWKSENYDRFITGFEFPELDWKKGVYEKRHTYPEQIELLKNERVSGIVIHKNKVLMVQRADSGLWGLPAGCREAFDDSISMSARRELFEETGLVALKWRLVNHVYANRGDGIRLGWVYEMQVVSNAHMDIDLELYIKNFNRKGGNIEISKLDLFDLRDIKDLTKRGLIFKPEYNFEAVKDYFKQRDSGLLDKINESYSPWDAADIFWNQQENLHFSTFQIDSPESLMPQLNF